MIKAAERWDSWNKAGGPNYPHDRVIQFLLRRYPEKSLRTPLNVLDLGCGGGVHMEFLAREGFMAHGRDISQVAIDKTLHRLEATGLTAASLCQSSVGNIEADDAQFDAVICIGVLDCAGAETLAPACREIFRVLRPGGACLAVFATDMDFRVVGENPLGLHGFTDEEVRTATSFLPPESATVWLDRSVITYSNQSCQQNEHLLTIIKSSH